jgi:tetratricopeptide (TPR) repeat protein
MNEFGELEGASGEKEFLAGALLGEGLPAEAEEYLELASQSYAAPDHAAVLIGLYRFYFYKGRIRQALEIANICLEKAARENALPRDWRKVAPSDAVFNDYEEILPRFFLFTLKGYAYLQMRLGEIDESRAAVMKLLELDPSDKIGAKVLLGILDRIGIDEDA